jgi:membrane protease YdiL (CAAX protease family)
MISERPWHLAAVLRLGAAVLLTWAGGTLLAALVVHLLPRGHGDTATLLVMGISMVSFQGAALVWVGIFLREHGTTWGDGFGLARRNYGHCAVIVLVVMPLVILGVLLLAKGSELALGWAYKQTHWLFLKPEPQQMVKLLKQEWPPAAVVLQGFAALVLAPVGEEVLFRGVLYPVLRRRHRVGAALLTSFVFAAVHFYPVGFLSFMFLSIALVAVYELTHNLFAPILLHCLFNTVNFVIIVAQPKWAERVFN